MTDPTHYIAAKIASAIGGIFGGASMMTFIAPKSIADAFARGSVSTGCAIIFTSPLLHLFNIEINWETQLMGGGIIGFLAYSILGAIANFFIKNQKSDIFEIAERVKRRTSRLKGVKND
jgi:hypothetical protein